VNGQHVVEGTAFSQDHCTVLVGVELALDEHNINTQNSLHEIIHDLQIAHRYHDLVH
jgi:hypothetical protein